MRNKYQFLEFVRNFANTKDGLRLKYGRAVGRKVKKWKLCM